MNAALCALHDAIKVDPRLYKNLLPSFASILKQVSGNERKDLHGCTCLQGQLKLKVSGEGAAVDGHLSPVLPCVAKRGPKLLALRLPS
eukprot:1157890-Pelagomonas_calceolata.AAC.3